MHKIYRGLASATGALALVATALVPSAAAPPQKTEVTWVMGEVSQVGVVEGFAGNSRVITFYARTDGTGDATVVNFDCPEGQSPSWDPNNGCEILGPVGMLGEELSVDIDRRLSAASVNGELRIYDGETETGEPVWGEALQLDVAMQAVGDAVINQEKQGGFWHWSKERSATVTTGQLGGFDVTGAVGTIGHLKETYKY